MSKQVLRTLGLGFLCSAILTGAFAVFGQGKVPVSGITVNSLFKPEANTDAELTQYKDEVSKLNEEKAKLESENKKLTDNMSALEEQMKQLEEKDTTTSETTTSAESTDETAEQTTTVDGEEEASTESDATQGTFTISEGEVSSEIAQRLQAEGYIADASELEAVIATWGLDTFIIAGDYQLSSDMSVHQVAEILTNGAYYYIP